MKHVIKRKKSDQLQLRKQSKDKSCSDTIKVETAIDEERKSLKLVNEAKLFH
jgi:hypothetical protein